MKEKHNILPSFTIPIILLFFFGSSCGLLEGENEKENTIELMPLYLGNWWEYEVHKPQWENQILDTVHYEVVKEITATFQEDSFSAFGFNLVPFPDDTQEYYWLIRNGEAGLYQMGGISETDTLFFNNLEYRYPAEIGETWEVPQLSFSRKHLDFYVSDTLKITLVDNNREVTTSAGTFTCYVYNFQVSAGEDVLNDFDYYLFYSPGVGLIKQEERGQHDQRVLTELNLIDYIIH